MIVEAQCPRCDWKGYAAGNPGPFLDLALEHQLQDHAVDHARSGDTGAMAELMGLAERLPSTAERHRRLRGLRP